MSLEYPVWLSDFIEKKYKNDEYKAADDPQYVEWAQDNPYAFADALWCFPNYIHYESRIAILSIRAKIIKSFKRESYRRQWLLKTNVIRPCKPTQCAYYWCCIRAAKDKPFPPKPTDSYF